MKGFKRTLLLVSVLVMVLLQLWVMLRKDRRSKSVWF